MGVFRDFVSGKTGRKITKTKAKVRNVQALNRLKRTGSAGPRPSDRAGALKASARTGVGISMFNVR